MSQTPPESSFRLDKLRINLFFYAFGGGFEVGFEPVLLSLRFLFFELVEESIATGLSRLFSDVSICKAANLLEEEIEDEY